MFAEPPSASSGRWASAWLQEEPPSLRMEREGDQEFPCLFGATLAHPFRLEGGVVCQATLGGCELVRLPSAFAEPSSASLVARLG